MPLTTQGYARPTLAEIKAEIEAAIVATFGQVDLTPQSVFGQLVGVFAEREAQVYEDVGLVYLSQYRKTAEGTSLDGVAQYIGLVRLGAEPTSITAVCLGDPGVGIPAGAQVSMSSTDTVFSTATAATISGSSLLVATVQVTEVADSTTYTVLLGADAISITSGAGATKEAIASALVSAINVTQGDVTATDNGDGTMDLAADNLVTPFSLGLGDRLGFVLAGSPVEFVATETGPLVAPAGTVDTIDTPVSGWQGVTNLTDGVVGRSVETDAELRQRMATSQEIEGASTEGAIVARLRQEISSISSVRMYQNRMLVTDSRGRPGKSFELVVVGGDDQEIADKIWETKPAGMETFGNITLPVLDINGDQQFVSFSRPEEVFIWVECYLTLYAGESFPAQGLDLVRTAIVEYGGTLGAGVDVLRHRFSGSIFTAVSGIADITIRLAISDTEAGPPSSYLEQNIPINEVQQAVFDVARVTVQVL